MRDIKVSDSFLLKAGSVVGADEVSQDFVLLGLDNHCHPMLSPSSYHQLGVDL